MFKYEQLMFLCLNIINGLNFILKLNKFAYINKLIFVKYLVTLDNFFFFFYRYCIIASFSFIFYTNKNVIIFVMLLDIMFILFYSLDC